MATNGSELTNAEIIANVQAGLDDIITEKYDYKLIQEPDQINGAVSELTDADWLGISIEKVPPSERWQADRLCLVTACSRDGPVFIFDITKMGQTTFTNGTFKLKELLEFSYYGQDGYKNPFELVNPTQSYDRARKQVPRKIMFDTSRSGAVLLGAGVWLDGIYDISLYEKLCRQHMPRTTEPATSIKMGLQNYLKDLKYEIHLLEEVKAMYYDTPKFEFWEQRPLTQKQLQYLAIEAKMLFNLKDLFETKVPFNMKTETYLRERTKVTLNESRSKDKTDRRESVIKK